MSIINSVNHAGNHVDHGSGVLLAYVYTIVYCHVKDLLESVSAPNLPLLFTAQPIVSVRVLSILYFLTFS